MRFLFQVFVVFLIIFNWRIPVLYNSVAVAMLLLIVYYLYNKAAIPVTYFFQRHNATILIATIALGVIVFAIPVFHGTEVLSGLEKRVWVQFMMLAAMILAIPLLIEGAEDVAFEKISAIICCAFALQGLIHLTGFLVAPIGDFLFEMKPESLQAAVSNPMLSLSRFRTYALTGSIFFELPAAYGIACILFFRLSLTQEQQYITGWQQYAILFLILGGIILSGRTGFVGLGIGVCFWILFSYQRIIQFFARNVWKIILIVSIILIVFNFLLSSKQRDALIEEVFPYAFEAYYNWRDAGKFTTNSTDLNFSEEFYYYLRDETLLVGQGLERDELHTVGYQSTDAGYMRSILFGGIPFLICLIIYQSLYFIRPLQFSYRGGTNEDAKDFGCFLSLFIYIFILHLKENAMGTCHIVETLYLIIGSSYMIRYYSKKGQEEIVK